MEKTIKTARLNLSLCNMADADEVFDCITPAVTKFMAWDMPTYDRYISRCKAKSPDSDKNKLEFVIRIAKTAECLGITAIENLDDTLPEMGIWLKETAHGRGYGREVIEALTKCASINLAKEGLIYPVALEDTASRRVAEVPDGQIIATRHGKKYESVVYKIPNIARDKFNGHCGCYIYCFSNQSNRVPSIYPYERTPGFSMECASINFFVSLKLKPSCLAFAITSSLRRASLP